MSRESLRRKRERVAEIIRRLHGEYPDARCSLDHEGAFQLLAATILSAQCTDERVNEVTPRLFERWPDAGQLAGARSEEVEDVIRPTGFFRNKTKSLLGMANAVVDRHAGEVPEDMGALTGLPGVGRKTANVVMGNAFGVAAGVVVDTHVKRLSGLLGLTREIAPERIEADLARIVPRYEWIDLPHLFIYHGREVCVARRPRCEACVLADLCPSSRV
ncbi:MAG TPA: endonuclease III [Longimicrobiales bacterium]|nr:endonuclease III [Longimicrobiales bacterium]